MSKRKKNLEKVIQQCKNIRQNRRGISKTRTQINPYDIEMRNFDEVPRGIFKGSKKTNKDNDAGTR